MNFPAANERIIRRLQGWSQRNPDIGAEEIAFLEDDDLLTFATSTDEAMAALEPLIETISFRLLKMFKRVNRLSHRPITVTLNAD